MVPPFPIEGGLPLALVRGLSVCGLVLASGGVFYPVVMAPAGLQRSTSRRLRLLGYAGLIAGLIGTVAWLLAESQDMAGDMAPASVWEVLTGTLFGHLVIARLVLLALALAAWRVLPVAAVVMAGAAALLQAGHSHAASMDGWSLLLGVAALHVLAASAWLGCLVPLFLVIMREPVEIGAEAARRFSPLGIACVGVLLLTAGVQGTVLLGGVPGIVGTGYGWMALLKAALFLVLVLLAARNRLVLAPGLRGASASQARQRFTRSIAIEVGVGVCVLLAAGVLTELPPGMHTQPVWPFPWQLSFEAVTEDPDLRLEAIEGAAGMAVAMLILGCAAVSLVWWRRSWRGWAARGAGALVAVLVAVMSAPHLDLLFAPAYPTQFFRSPTGFTVVSVVDGAGLFAQNCAACHGAAGRGDGPAARGLSVPPANLTAAHLWMHSDGELFWWLSHGIAGPEGGLAMPGFADTLSDDQRWDLIDYIRAHNAGTSVTDDGRWARIIAAPAFGAQCANGVARQLRDFAGAPVRLVIGTAATSVPGLVTISTKAGTIPGAASCVAREEQIAPAYAVAAGLSGDVTGAVFLIDADGLLRRVWKPGTAPDQAGILQALNDIRGHKVRTAMAEGAGMKMNDMPMGGMKMDTMKMDGMKM